MLCSRCEVGQQSDMENASKGSRCQPGRLLVQYSSNTRVLDRPAGQAVCRRQLVPTSGGELEEAPVAHRDQSASAAGELSSKQSAHVSVELQADQHEQRVLLVHSGVVATRRHRHTRAVQRSVDQRVRLLLSGERERRAAVAAAAAHAVAGLGRQHAHDARRESHQRALAVEQSLGKLVHNGAGHRLVAQSEQRGSVQDNARQVVVRTSHAQFSERAEHGQGRLRRHGQRSPLEQPLEQAPAHQTAQERDPRHTQNHVLCLATQVSRSAQALRCHGRHRAVLGRQSRHARSHQDPTIQVSAHTHRQLSENNRLI